MKNNKMLIIAIGSIATIIILSIIGINCNECNDFFSYSFVDVLTLVVASIIIFSISEKNSDKRKKNEKIEDIIEKINEKLNEIRNQIPTLDKKSEYLYIFKYISNKFNVLKEISSKEDQIHIEKAENNFENIRTFVIDNINQKKEYFENLKDKIPNLISNIETNLDKIIIDIYKKM